MCVRMFDDLRNGSMIDVDGQQELVWFDVDSVLLLWHRFSWGAGINGERMISLICVYYF